MPVAYIAAGVNHFVNPGFYTEIMPPYIPAHLAMVYLSGVFEIVLGALLFPRQTRVIAAWGIIAMLFAFMPVHIHMATHPEQYPQVSPLLLWMRLPLQGVLIAWAWAYTLGAKAAVR